MSDVIEFPVPKGKKPDRTMTARWGGHPEIWNDGYVAVPTAFLRSLQSVSKTFKLPPAEGMFVIQVMSYKWGVEFPYPGYKTLAKHMGISTVYARGLARSLETKGLLRRIVKVGTTNRFDFAPLFEAIAAAASSGRARRKTEQAATA